MHVTKEAWLMHEQCVPGSLSTSPSQEPGNEAILLWGNQYYSGWATVCMVHLLKLTCFLITLKTTHWKQIVMVSVKICHWGLLTAAGRWSLGSGSTGLPVSAITNVSFINIIIHAIGLIILRSSEKPKWWNWKRYPTCMNCGRCL